MAQSVVLASGPRIFTSSGGAPIRIPRIIEYPIGTGTGASATYWYSENQQIVDTDPEFGEMTLLPSTLKSIKVLHRFSNELARLSVLNIANALRDAIVRRMTLALDAAFLTGTGANSTVRGIVSTPGILTETYAGSPTVDDLHDALGQSLAANANPSVWLMHPDAFTTLRKQREGAGSGAYLLQSDPTAANVFRLLGLPVRTSTQLPPGTMLLIDMGEIAVARDVDMAVKLLDQTFGDFDQLALTLALARTLELGRFSADRSSGVTPVGCLVVVR